MSERAGPGAASRASPRPRATAAARTPGASAACGFSSDAGRPACRVRRPRRERRREAAARSRVCASSMPRRSRCVSPPRAYPRSASVSTGRLVRRPAPPTSLQPCGVWPGQRSTARLRQSWLMGPRDPGRRTPCMAAQAIRALCSGQPPSCSEARAEDLFGYQCWSSTTKPSWTSWSHGAKRPPPSRCAGAPSARWPPWTARATCRARAWPRCS
mmetsp:Transcript_50978/g.158053  ORF Transcript_50978/g.158053 Transcript_50978/m.158053 type:complete len:214 (-) Transcript_50978:481-1122(-)